MTIYDIPDRYSIGKDIPTVGPFKGYKPNIVGPGAGKIKAGIYAAYTIGKFVAKRPWAQGTIAGTAIGTGVTINSGTIPTQPPAYSVKKALRSAQSVRSRSWRSKQGRVHKCCQCC